MKNFKKRGFTRHQAGFTLIEVLIVIGIIAILAGVVIVAINPARQFAQARNSERMSNLNAILNAIGQNIADNQGIFTCAAGTLPASSTLMATGAGHYDIRPCLVPTYVPELLVDPAIGTPWNGTSYNTQYTVSASSTTSRISICAPAGAEAAIASSTTLCVTR